MIVLNYNRGEHTSSQLKATERKYQTGSLPLKHRAQLGIKSPFLRS